MEATASTAPAWYHVYYTDASSNNYLMLLVCLGVIFCLALAWWAQHKWYPFMWNKTGIITLTPQEIKPNPVGHPNLNIHRALEGITPTQENKPTTIETHT